MFTLVFLYCFEVGLGYSCIELIQGLSAFGPVTKGILIETSENIWVFGSELVSSESLPATESHLFQAFIRGERK